MAVPILLPWYFQARGNTNNPECFLLYVGDFQKIQILHKLA